MAVPVSWEIATPCLPSFWEPLGGNRIEVPVVLGNGKSLSPIVISSYLPSCRLGTG